MRPETDSLTASLRVRESERRFVVRLPRRFGKRPVLDLCATYLRGDGYFGARLRLP